MRGVRRAGREQLRQPACDGAVTFEVFSILSMLIVGLVIMTETTGDMVAVGEIVDKPVTRRQLADGLREHVSAGGAPANVRHQLLRRPGVDPPVRRRQGLVPPPDAQPSAQGREGHGVACNPARALRPG